MVRLAAVFVLASAAQPCAQGAAWSAEQRDVQVPMRDGNALAADVYLPAARGRYPAILVQTPYDKQRLDAPIAGAARREEAGGVGRGAVSDVLEMLDRGHYAYVVVDWRGFYGSRAAMGGVDRRRWRRGLDGHDCVEWIAKQGWSDGKVGTWGGSALGKQQFSTAIEHPPHLVCCAPLIAAMGVGYDQYFAGGVPLDAHLRTLDRLGYDLRTRARANPLPGAPLWRVAERATYRPQDIDVPCLVVTGWWDHDPSLVIRTFEDIVQRGGARARAHSRLLIGPWDHVSVGLARQGDLSFAEAQLASAGAARAFFDFHLRGVQNGWDGAPRVRYFDSGAREWRSCGSWSGAPRAVRVLHGDARGRLAPDPAPEPGKRAYDYDPRRASPTLGGANLPPLSHGPRAQNPLLAREDVLVYRTGRLDAALALEGRVAVSFTFVVDRVDCDFCLRLCDVDDKGSACLLADAAARAKLRNGKVEPLVPGVAYRLTIEFPDHCHTFAAGHELMVILTSGNRPRYERNPHTGADLWDRAKALPLHVEVHSGGDTPFEVRVPVPDR